MTEIKSTTALIEGSNAINLNNQIENDLLNSSD